MSPSTAETQRTETSPIECPTVNVDPGQVIRVNARFPGNPAAVLFSFLPPQSDVATHDPGAGAAGSELQRDGDLYHYFIDTRLMRGGLGWWHFVSDDPDPSKRRAKVGKFIVRDVPRALLERGGPPAVAIGGIHEETCGFDMLGAQASESETSPAVLIGVAVVVGVVLVLL